MDWYAERVPGLDEAFYEAFLGIVRRASTMPMMYPEVDSPVRRALLPGFPFVVFYAVDDDTVIFLACLHERRSPDRWPQV